MRSRRGKLAEARGLFGGIYGWVTEGLEVPDLRRGKTLRNPAGNGCTIMLRQQGFDMPDIVEELAQRGLSLSPEDRARLAERLLDSLQEPVLADIEAAWNEEIARRVAAHKRGEVESFDAEDVFAEARQIAP